MRADRLLGLLMLLQQHGRMTARRLADELEVSERTIHRDVFALRVAGVPVDTVRGAGGGIALHGRWRSDLTGLTASEASALVSLSSAGPAADLGRGADLRRALTKLAAALPDALQPTGEPARARIHIDPRPLHRAGGPPPLLPALHRAVLDDRWTHLRLRRSFDTIVARRAALLGLVAKASEWYLVWMAPGGRPVVDPVTAVVGIRRGRPGAERPPGFDLRTFWEEWCSRAEAARPAYRATVRTTPEALPWVRHRLGQELESRRNPDGSRDVTFAADSIEDARNRVLSLGGAVEVLAPPALRLAVADAARHAAARYGA